MEKETDIEEDKTLKEIFQDTKKQKIPIFWPFIPKQDILKEIEETLDGRWLGQGPKVEKFEREFARKFGYQYVLFVNSGTSALELAYHLLDIKKNDEVIVPVLDCTAGQMGLIRRGAKIVFADIEKNTMNIDPVDVKKKITEKTKAIIVVHLGGIEANPEIFKLAKEKNIPIIVDASQHHAPKNLEGDYICYSLQAIKHITTADGGVLVLRDKREYDRAKLLRWFGIDRELKAKKNYQAWERREMTFDIDEAGYKYQPTDIDACFGLASLPYLEEVIEYRKSLAMEYINGLPREVIPVAGGSYWLFGILSEYRDELAEFLLNNGIDCNMVQLRNDIFDVFKEFKSPCPNMDYIHERYLYLPINPAVSKKNVKYICAKVKEFYEQKNLGAKTENKMRHALVCFGNEENYGLFFVGSELEKFNQEIKFFDAEGDEKVIENITRWKPDFIHFSPMTTFFPQAYNILKDIKKILPDTISVFGGHHATASPEIAELEYVDIVVRGPVKGAIEQILNRKRGIITTVPKNPDDLQIPAREKCYEDIPRMGQRYRKIMLSMLGCPYSCTYCSSSSLHRVELFGPDAQRRYFLGRRQIDTIIEEGKIVKKYPTDEIEWVDDDLFAGANAEEWLSEFIDRWKEEIDIPMYVSTTSISVLKVSDEILRKLRKIVNCVGLGVQAIRPDSLKIFNRQWDNEEKLKEAYDRLVSFGYRVNLQAIVGLPLKDPVEDALDTLEALKRIGPGSIVSIYPLQIYPHTHIKEISESRGFKVNENCPGDTNTGVGGLLFPPEIERKIRNICKFGTLYVKGEIDSYWKAALSKGGEYDLIKDKIDKEWLKRALDTDFDSETSKMLSMARYHDCVIDRLGKIKGEEVFNKILKTTNIRY